MNFLRFQATTIRDIALRMAEMPKHNTKRSRMVVITQGSDPVIVAQGKCNIVGLYPYREDQPLFTRLWYTQKHTSTHPRYIRNASPYRILMEHPQGTEPSTSRLRDASPNPCSTRPTHSTSGKKALSKKEQSLPFLHLFIHLAWTSISVTDCQTRFTPSPL